MKFGLFCRRVLQGGSYKIDDEQGGCALPYGITCENLGSGKFLKGLRLEGILGHDMGGGNVPENALSRKLWTPPKELLVCSIVDFVQEEKSNDTRGGWKTYRTRGGPWQISPGGGVGG